MVCALLGTQSARLAEFVRVGLGCCNGTYQFHGMKASVFLTKTSGEVAVKFIIVSKPMDGFCISHNNSTLSLPKIDHPESKSKRLLYIYICNDCGPGDGFAWPDA